MIIFFGIIRSQKVRSKSNSFLSGSNTFDEFGRWPTDSNIANLTNFEQLCDPPPIFVSLVWLCELCKFSWQKNRIVRCYKSRSSTLFQAFSIGDLLDRRGTSTQNFIRIFTKDSFRSSLSRPLATVWYSSAVSIDSEPNHRRNVSIVLIRLHNAESACQP